MIEQSFRNMFFISLLSVLAIGCNTKQASQIRGDQVTAVTLPPVWTPSPPDIMDVTTSTPQTTPLTTPDIRATPLITLEIRLAQSRTPSAQEPPSVFEYPGRMYSNNNGWAVVMQPSGIDVERLFHTTDGGRQWHDVLESEPHPVTRRILFTLDGFTSWLISSNFVIGDSGTYGPTRVYIKTTSDGGLNWLVNTLEIDPANYVVDAIFLNSQTGWLLTIPYEWQKDPATVVYRTDDGGETWRELDRNPQGIDLEQREGELPLLCTPSGLMFVEELTGWITGVCDGVPLLFYRSVDGGLTWKAQVPQIPPGEPSSFYEDNATYPDSPIFVNPRDGYFFLLKWVMTDPQMFLYTTHDGGETWRLGVVPSFANRTWFDAIDGEVAWSTDGEKVFISEDGWRSWRFVSDSPDGWISNIEFVDDRTGWIVTNADIPVAVFFTTNAGMSWERIHPHVIEP